MKRFHRDATEYSIELLDPTGESFAGASVPAADDDAANDEARELALEHGALRARIRCKDDGRTWLLECETPFSSPASPAQKEAEELRELVEVLCENQRAGYINDWWISSHTADQTRAGSVNGRRITAVGADLSIIEGSGETWDAAKNTFADALLLYLERLQPVGSA